MTNEDSGTSSDLFKTVLGLFGSFAALAAAIYAFGGFVLYERLGLRDLRTDAVVSSLPREFLISVGLAVLAQFGLFLLVLLVAYVQEAKLPLGEREGRRLHLEVTWASAARVAIAIVATAVLALPLYRWITWEGVAWYWWWPLILPGIVLAAVATFVALLFILEWSVNGPSAPDFDIATLKSAGLLTLFAFLIFIPWRVALEAASIDSFNTRVCTANPSHSITGIFIGGNDSRVYVGETEFPHRIAEIPRTDVTRIYIGKNAATTPCPSSLESLTIIPTKVQGGIPSSGVVVLKGEAPRGGKSISLSSSNQSVATVIEPPVLHLLEGQSSKTFMITTHIVTSDTGSVISASSEGVTKTAALSVTKPSGREATSPRTSARR